MALKFMKRCQKPILRRENLIARELRGKLFRSPRMIAAESARKLNELRFELIVVARAHLLGAAHSRNEIGNQPEMMTHRVAGNRAGSRHARQFDDLGNDPIDLFSLIEVVAPPRAWEVSPFHQRPARRADLVQGTVIAAGISSA